MTARELVVVLTLVLVALVQPHTSTAPDVSKLPRPWGWRCVNETCVKEENNGVSSSLQDLSTCKLTCASYSLLWPKPTGLVHIGDKTVYFLPESLQLLNVVAPTEEVRTLVHKAFDIFKDNVKKNLPDTDTEGNFVLTGSLGKKVAVRRVRVTVTVSDASTRLTLDTPEKSTLKVTTKGDITNVTILAANFFGARHALESLSQLIEYDDLIGALQIVSKVAITDAPAFSYRGIMLDTSRNFYSVKALERTLDAMAASKLNTFHWHITDSHTFPLYLTTVPKMAYYGTYSPRQVYRPKDVKHLVEYGRVRGVRVVPELDAPAHAGNGWQWTEKEGLGRTAVCVNQVPTKVYCLQPPCGQLNVVNKNTYTILGKIYQEMVDLFGPLELFHFGGDEISLACWNTTEEFLTYLKQNGLTRDPDTFYKLWGDFQNKAFDLLKKANKGERIPAIVWTSELTNENQIDKYFNPENYVIQIWTSGQDKVIGDLLNRGFRIILSNHDAWYFDCGFGHPHKDGKSWCGGYKGWQTVYNNSPDQIATNLTGSTHRDLVLGGEACMWSEMVDESSLDAKLWPRGSALGERLWTNPSHNWESAERRFIHHRQRLMKRGIMAERIQPEWCHQNEGLCYNLEQTATASATVVTASADSVIVGRVSIGICLFVCVMLCLCFRVVPSQRMVSKSLNMILRIAICTQETILSCGVKVKVLWSQLIDFFHDRQRRGGTYVAGEDKVI